MSYTPRILVVDDESRMCESLEILLGDKGYHIKTFINGQDALNYLEDNECDLALLDLMMPGMDGYQIMTCLQDHHPNVDVITMTGQSSIESAIRALKGGAYDYLCKPFEYGELIKKVENVLNHKRLKRERDTISEKLESAEARYQYLVQNSPDIIFTLGDGGEFVFINQTVESLVGLKRNRLIGKPFTSIVHHNDIHKVSAYIQAVRTGEGLPSLLELNLKCTQCSNNGSLCQGDHSVMEMKAVSLADVAWRGVNGEPSAVYGIIRDITKRKQTEEENKILEGQLRQAQKMEAIGTLAGGIAHDFNNLLMAIQGNISLMLYHINDSHPYYERLRKIERNIESGAKLTSQLLGYARKGKYEVKAVEINRIVEETANTFSRMRKDVCFQFSLDEALVRVDADANQIEQVLMNLFLNAADAMPGGGDIMIETKNIDHVAIKSMLYNPKPGRYAHLSVKDKGVGMDDQTKERIFEPFFTTKEMGKGTGLGLASVYGIIKGHQGFIDVDSTMGTGTTFHIYLPASENVALEITGGDSGAILHGNETVLLVDDEEDVLEIGKAMMEAIGYRTIIARGGQEALKLYEENKGRIDLVLLDMVMPGLNGGKVYDHLKTIDPKIKVLLLSGFSIDGQAKEILSRGCNGFMQKPFKIKELSKRIRDILENRP